jgi:hypothetical protein
MHTNQIKFVIRDDDLNYFSTPADIERWYGEIFAKNIPVGFSTIPFVKPISDVYTAAANSGDKEYPISRNENLVRYIREQKLIEILQHGCTHETRNGVFEYQKKQGLIEETLRGKKELEDALDVPINVFVAPHDQFSNHAIKAIENAKLNVIRSKGSKNFFWNKRYIGSFLKMLFYRVRYLYTRGKKMPAYPRVIDLGKHKEAFSYRIELGKELLLQGLKFAQMHGDHFIIVTHLHMLTEEQKKLLGEVIEHAHTMNVVFARPSDLFYDHEN